MVKVYTVSQLKIAKIFMTVSDTSSFTLIVLLSSKFPFPCYSYKS